MERWLKSACTPIESRPTRLWQQTGVLYSCYPSPAGFFPPLLREELRRNELRLVTVYASSAPTVLSPYDERLPTARII
jgi:hypothetical protein